MSGYRNRFVLILIILITALFPNQVTTASSLKIQKDENVIAYHPLTGMVRFMGAQSGTPILGVAALQSKTTVEEAAFSFLALRGRDFGIADARKNMQVLRETHGENNTSTVHFQQTHQGVPILAGEAVVQMDAAKNILSASGDILPNIKLDVTPLVDAATAAQTALYATAKESGFPVEDLQASAPELWIYNPALLTPYKGTTLLTWRIEVTPVTELAPIRQLVLVEAKRGGIALSFNQTDFAKNRQTYSTGGTNTLPGTLVCDESNPTCTGGSTDAVNAHVYAGQTYDFYLTNHGRDSIDGAGMALISTVDYDKDPGGLPYPNAFWSGTQMVYGAGFASADDAVAHELTHGVTDYESKLYYYWQSGAINESLSDVWGEFMDLGNGMGNDTPGVRWLIGEDLPVGALRSMSDPTLFGNADKMTSANYQSEYDEDNWGVHQNSGINNKAAFLMVDGGSFNGQTVSPLGITKVAKIYYYAQTHLLTSGSDYADLYYALQTSCAVQIGTAGITGADCDEVLDAVNAVEMNLQPTVVAEYNQDALACNVNGEYPVNRFYDDFESGATNWISGATVGSNRFTYDWVYTDILGTFAHSGQHFMYADDYPGEPTASFLRMANSVTIPPNGQLLFHHAYILEDDFDGVILEYSTNGGASWTDAGSLMTVNGYDGTLLTGSSNPLANGTQQAFTGLSNGYISTRVNLASLAGQNVMFRFRIGLDISWSEFGWWLDDVQIYECKDPGVDLSIGGVLQDTYDISPGESTRDSYAGVNNGPVKALGLNSFPIIASERVAYTPDGGTTWTSFDEMMGLPSNQLTDTYYFPYYNNVEMNTQLRFGNVGTSNTVVTVTIGGVVQGSYFVIPNQSMRLSYNLNSGPVKVQSSGNVPIIASIRFANIESTSPLVVPAFTEMMGLPGNQLTTTYIFPYYNNVEMNTQLRFGNVGTSATNVTVTIGGVVQGVYPVAPSQSVRLFYNLNSGPVKIQSLVASRSLHR